jgi:hypothetical protein
MHRDHRVQEFARELNIQLIFIQLGLTYECQPLHRRVFGNLKQCAHRRFNNEILQSSFDSVCMGWALKLLVDVWK